MHDIHDVIKQDYGTSFLQILSTGLDQISFENLSRALKMTFVTVIKRHSRDIMKGLCAREKFIVFVRVRSRASLQRMIKIKSMYCWRSQ